MKNTTNAQNVQVADARLSTGSADDWRLGTRPPIVDDLVDQGDPSDQGDQGDQTELKGEALDAALEAAGLPKTGSADEKRARLAEADTRAGGDDSTS